MNKLWRIVMALMVLNAIAVVHEGGHYVALRAIDVAVEEVGFGMGPRIGSVKLGETRVSFRILPLGGYTAPRELGERSMAVTSYRKGFFVDIAGVAAGFIVAFGMSRFRRREEPEASAVEVEHGTTRHVGVLGPIAIIQDLFNARSWRERFEQFVVLNISVAYFNLIPIYPLDGGRVANQVIGSMFGDRASIWFQNISIITFAVFIIAVFLQDGARLFKR